MAVAMASANLATTLSGLSKAFETARSSVAPVAGFSSSGLRAARSCPLHGQRYGLFFFCL